MSVTASAPPVFDAGSADFQASVVDASRRTPVLVDFWASWCGPCKALAPVLEKLAREADGSFVLAKVDTDAHRDLAMAQGIRSLPTVRLFVDGHAVAEFMGAHPESAVRGFLDQHLPRAVDDEGLGRVEACLGAGDAVTARAALDALDEAARESPQGGILAARVSLLEQAAPLPGREELEAALGRDPADIASRFDLGLRLAADGRHEEAMDSLLAVLARDRRFRDGAAREAMLQVFDALGPGDPRVGAYRGRLASLLN